MPIGDQGLPGDRNCVCTGPNVASCYPSPASIFEALQRPVESAQYVSIKYSERLAEAGIEPSVGSVGDSYDNALAETINGLYKAEVIHKRGPWRSFEAVEYAVRLR
ncbi:MAG: integrase, catalytic region [Bradyrhizobium sp.]|nr:integrase, catalytic region [Bradyrhizobium sp.]